MVRVQGRFFYHNTTGVWALKPYHLGPWTLRVMVLLLLRLHQGNALKPFKLWLFSIGVPWDPRDMEVTGGLLGGSWARLIMGTTWVII